MWSLTKTEIQVKLGVNIGILNYANFHSMNSSGVRLEHDTNKSTLKYHYFIFAIFSYFWGDLGFLYIKEKVTYAHHKKY